MSEIIINIFLQMCSGKHKKQIDKWFILSVILMFLGLAIASLALIIGV